MVIDELVTTIAFDMPSSAKSALSGVNRAISGITDKIKGLGIVSAVTSGIFAAFSVNAARDATSLANLSDSIGVNMKEVEALGAVYRQLGGDAKNFASDADAFKRMTGQSLNLDKMVKLSRQFKGLSKEAAYQFGRAYGFSDDMIRVLMKGPDELRKMGDEATRNNTTNEKSLDNLKKLDSAWTDLKNVIGPVANEVQGAFAPILEGGLTWLAELLKENKDSIRETMTAISDSVRTAYRAIEKYAGDAWTAAKPYLIDGWGVVKNAVTDAWNVVRPIFDAYADAWISIYNAVSKLDFKGAMQGIYGYLKPSDGLMSSVTSSLEGIKSSIVGFYRNIKESVDGGALGRMWDTLKDIANSPVIQALLGVLKSVQETIAGIGWAAIESAFKVLEAAAKPVMEVLQGVLDTLSGILNLDWRKTVEGLQQIGYALINFFGDLFAEILPDLLKKILKQLPIIGGYFKDDESGESKAVTKGTPSGDNANEAYTRSPMTSLRMRPGDFPELAPGELSGRGNSYSSSLTNNQTSVTIYQTTPPTPNAEIYKDTGGMGFNVSGGR